MVAELVASGLFVAESGPLTQRAQVTSTTALKDALRSAGRKTSGNKAQLIERLTDMPEVLERLAEVAWTAAAAGHDTERRWLVEPSAMLG